MWVGGGRRDGFGYREDIVRVVGRIKVYVKNDRW